jgi:divalent metal cation (Fe/Co/Zn/Cd) transporter
MVIRAGWTNTRAALLELADVGIDEELKDSVRKVVTKALSADDAFGAKSSPQTDTIALRNVQGIKAGQNYLVEIELAVPGSWNVDETRKVEDAVRERVGSKVRGVRRVKVRFVANNNELPDFSDEFIGTDISPRTSPEPEDEEEARQEKHSHDHRANGESRKSR